MTKGRKPRLRPATVKAAVFFLAPRREDYEHFLGKSSPVKNVNAGGAPSPPGDRLAEMTRAANQRSLKKATTRYLNQRSPLSKKGNAPSRLRWIPLQVGHAVQWQRHFQQEPPSTSRCTYLLTWVAIWVATRPWRDDG